MKRSWLARHPVGFMALYSIFYLSVFHYLEALDTFAESLKVK